LVISEKLLNFSPRVIERLPGLYLGRLDISQVCLTLSRSTTKTMTPSLTTLIPHTHLNREERRLHFYAKGENIPTGSQGVWRVCQGIVQLSTLYPNGEEGLLGWVGSGMCFSLWLTSLETYQAKALSDVYLIWYSIGEIENSPTLAKEILPQLTRRLRQVEGMLAIAGYRRVEERLRQLLLLLQQEIGQNVAEGTRIIVRLTHQDIANAINTSRVTVTRLLGQFKKKGVISFDSQRHLIIRHGKLSLCIPSSDFDPFQSNAS